MKKRAMTLVLMLALTAGVASALDVGGTSVPDKAEVAGQSLLLNGAGVRKKVVFDVYVASLYTGAKVGDAATILGATTPRRMELRMLREVSAGTMHESFVDGLQDNISAGDMKRFAPQLDALDKVFREVKTVGKGDVIQLDLLPGQGTRVTVRGKAYPVIAGDDFASALLSIWLGKSPVQAGLKAQLLGAR